MFFIEATTQVLSCDSVTLVSKDSSDMTTTRSSSSNRKL